MPATSSVSTYRSQAAACSSRVMLGDGLPLLMNAPCPHREQISTRGSDAAVAPTWPQFGQVIRVSMSVSIAAAGVVARPSMLVDSSVGYVGGDAPGLVDIPPPCIIVSPAASPGAAAPIAAIGNSIWTVPTFSNSSVAATVLPCSRGCLRLRNIKCVLDGLSVTVSLGFTSSPPLHHDAVLSAVC